MMDEIFELLMKEATTRKGPDLVSNIYTVLLELRLRIYAAMQAIRAQEREHINDNTLDSHQAGRHTPPHLRR